MNRTMQDESEILIITAPCLGKALGKWLEHLRSERRLADNTLIAYERDMRQFCHHLTDYLGHPAKKKDFADLKPLHMRGYLARRRESGNGPRTIARDLAGIRSFVRFLEKRGEAVEYPEKIATGDGPVTVFDPGLPLYWRVV